MQPPVPSRQEVAEHEATGHAVFRTWCPACVAGRGVGQQHVRVQRKLEQEVPVIALDYAYLSNPGNRDDVVTLVVARDRRTRSLCASALARKGSDKFAIQVIIDFVRHLGWRRIILKSDSEESIMALKGGVRAGLDDVDVAFE